MVHDTGATPTMSPNPAFQRRQKPQDTDNQAQNLDFQQHFGDGREEKEEFDWDDGWEEPAGEVQASEREVSLSLVSSSARGTGSKSVAGTTTTTAPRIVGAHAGPKSPLAPMSAIPTGLASIAGAAPTAQQMSSWVGSVGKRWDEITGSTA